MKIAETAEHLPVFVSKMQAEGLAPLVIDTFSYYYQKLVTGESGLVYDRDIRAVAPEELADLAGLSPYTAPGQKAFPHSIWIVLNGGLGTTMGLTGTKSLVEVKCGRSFLDIIVRQAENNQIRLGFMNSFRTHAETLAALSDLKPSRFPLLFIQNKFPKILKKNLTPAAWPPNPDLEWNPPGHGDVFCALHTSGLLQTLLAEGIQYAFISNSDNLGARLEASLLGYFADRQFPFMMEIAEKTPADIKGGHLARHKEGRLILREAAQCPPQERAAFLDIRRYRFFNTNNIWVNLPALKTLFEKQGTLRLPMILNPKTLDPRDEKSPPVFQIETAMGAAIALFEGSTAV
ncbi:MAG: UTP--glucose-1-phosphate uridylyltransferase, partial [Desulfobacterales bacterium]